MAHTATECERVSFVARPLHHAERTGLLGWLAVRGTAIRRWRLHAMPPRVTLSWQHDQPTQPRSAESLPFGPALCYACDGGALPGWLLLPLSDRGRRNDCSAVCSRHAPRPLVDSPGRRKWDGEAHLSGRRQRSTPRRDGQLPAACLGCRCQRHGRGHQSSRCLRRGRRQGCLRPNRRLDGRRCGFCLRRLRHRHRLARAEA